MGEAAHHKSAGLARHINIQALLRVTRKENNNWENYRAALHFDLQNYWARISHISARIKSISQSESWNAQAVD